MSRRLRFRYPARLVALAVIVASFAAILATLAVRP